MLRPPLPGKRMLLIWLLAVVLAGACTVGILLNIPQERVEAPEAQQNDIRSEVLCRIAATPQEEIPTAIESDTPHLRLREYAPGCYELLYWGNPIRKHYTYSVRKVSDNRSVLLDSQGKMQRWCKLPVTTPRRADKKLPLQPAVRLRLQRNTHHEYYAVKVSVHDGTTGRLLCTELYLIKGIPGTSRH